MNEILTFTGKYIDPFNPKIEDIDVEDIANSLSRQCRFGGHLRWFYTVAEHSLRVAKELPDELKLTGLLHDAAEAYLLDIPRPVKMRIPGYKDAEENLLKIIMEKFGGIYPLPELVTKIDNEILEWEFANVVAENVKLSNKFIALQYTMANKLFLDGFNKFKIMGEING